MNTHTIDSLKRLRICRRPSPRRSSLNEERKLKAPLTLTSEEARACYRALIQSSINLYDYIEAERVLDLARKFLPTDFAFKDVA